MMSKIFFDKQDHELLTIVNEVLNREKSRKDLKSLFIPYLHPNGIKEMAAPKELRIAYAVIHLLDMLQTGGPADRLTALRSVWNEVLHCARSDLRMNTARVLLQTMKELVRSHGDYQHQLELAHDFRTASSGKPRFIRKLLRRYHLLEMPEKWNQVAFDHHVHDMNTKGRKSPTHLTMDAWIKGIRSLTIIHYNFVTREAAAELLEAAEIMDLEVRIGIEFSTRFRGRYVSFIWIPRGFGGLKDFLDFLAKPEVESLMAKGRLASEYQQGYVWKVFDFFNQTHLPEINKALSINAPFLDRQGFTSFVRPGQVSLLHLAQYAHRHLMPALKQRNDQLRAEYLEAGEEDRLRIAEQISRLDLLDSITLYEKYLNAQANPGLENPRIPHDGPDIPEIFAWSPYRLIEELTGLRTGFRLTLNLTDLQVEDVLELIYDCRGVLTHLEIFNLKDYISGKKQHIYPINQLQQAINQGSVVKLKRLIHLIIKKVEESNAEDRRERVEKLREILHQIGALKHWYGKILLKAHIGSDSTGRSARIPGMGLAVLGTLPARAQREYSRGRPGRSEIPVQVNTYINATYYPEEDLGPRMTALYGMARKYSWMRLWGTRIQEDWKTQNASIVNDAQGNVISLGGIGQNRGNGFQVDENGLEEPGVKHSLTHLNSKVKNILKILVGFIPAFLTFYLTKDWWVLAYFGAVIWFGITGFRNVIQSVLGAGGVKRSPLLRWKDYVSWSRFSDSLFFTGFSVPLLDYLVKTLLLDRGFGITTATNPVLLYTTMAAANGLYISCHNTLRGLPRGAIYGNMFRSILSIPLAVVLNAAAGSFLGFQGVVGVETILQKWAAIISKTASDFVAGVIEGAADRYNNIRIRTWDYADKIRQVFDTFAELELHFPEMDVLEMLESPKKFIHAFNSEASGLVKMVIINSLDLLYFWMFQPRSRSVLKRILKAMSDEERLVFERSLYVLQRKREVSQMFLDGLVGKKFSKALAFYLDRSEEYLEAMRRLLTKMQQNQGDKRTVDFSANGASG